MILSDLGPDIEGDIRTRLRADTGVTDLVGQRVFLSTRTLTEASFPCVIVSRVGGGDHPTSDAPIDQPLLQLDVWGPATSKQAATDVVNAVRNALRQIGAETISVIWLPDPDNRRPRYVLTAAVSSISS